MTRPHHSGPAALGGAAGPAPIPLDWKRLRELQRMVLHRVLHLGLANPVPLPSPMSEDEGAWVRREVMPAWWRGIDGGYPYGFYRWCYCQKGYCWNCVSSRCDWCIHRQHGRPDIADDVLGSVTMPDSRKVARLVQRDGEHRCVWLCRCPCPKTDTAAPDPPVLAEPAAAQAPAPPPAPASPARPSPALVTGQLDLFGETA